MELKISVPRRTRAARWSRPPSYGRHGDEIVGTLDLENPLSARTANMMLFSGSVELSGRTIMLSATLLYDDVVRQIARDEKMKG